MGRAKRVCSASGCPTLVESGRCPEHQREADAKRGTRQARGYDANHDRLRLQWAPKVAAGTVTCWRCGELIAPDQAWDLGHKTATQYGGPEHARQCNRSAAGRASHGLEWKRGR